MNLEPIQNKIYEIRGYKVMLDFDLADIYGIETRVLKQAVRRNIKRFEGEDFMFELSKDELSRSQFVTLNKGRGKNIKYKPFAFTELGVALLSSVLNSETAISINRSIMRAFVTVRHLVLNPPTDRITELEKRMLEMKLYLEEFSTYQNDINEDTRTQLELINEALVGLQAERKELEKPRRRIGYGTKEEFI
jgi:hypothetical protein